MEIVVVNHPDKFNGVQDQKIINQRYTVVQSLLTLIVDKLNDLTPLRENYKNPDDFWEACLTHWKRVDILRGMGVDIEVERILVENVKGE
jgi:hypothetical protein